MPSDTEIEVARCVIRDAIRAYWEATPEDAEKMVDGYRAMAKAALEAAERSRDDWLELYKLPCDVRLPPNTIIRKGCSLKTLITGLIARETIDGEKPAAFQ